jgi:hypothetical protein
MKIALLVLLGLFLGALGGAALGIGAGLAWVEIFKTSNFEGHSGMLVFFTFMPLGAILGGLAGAITFGVLTWRDAEIAIERRPKTAAKALASGMPRHLCNAKTPVGFLKPSPYFCDQQLNETQPPPRCHRGHRGACWLLVLPNFRNDPK